MEDAMMNAGGDDAMMMEDTQPLVETVSKKPSDKWGKFTDSNFSEKHLNEETKKIRTSSSFITLANICKMYVGIAFVSTPKSVQQAGLYGFIICVVYVIVSTIISVYILLKARNRFKREEIIDICDLGAKLYGEWLRPWLEVLIVVTNAIALIMYTMFFGFVSDQLMCKTFQVAECH